jgi:Flp pilus assembly protein TadB
MSFLPLLLGTGIGAGLALVVWGLRPRAPQDDPWRRMRRIWPRFADLPARLARAAVAGLIIGLLTRWPIAVIGGAALGFFASDLFAGRGQRGVEVDRTAAIASWTEMLRDTMAAAAGLEQAIVTTAPLAPEPIAPQIRALISRLERERLAPALSRLADDLADPTADLVVSALTLAASGEAQDLSDLLGSLAGAARDNATMRLKIEASRARTRTSVRIITAVTICMALLLVVLNRNYLSPFDTAAGQGVLLAVVACFAGGLWWLAAMARYAAPERFVVGHRGEESSWS